MKLVIAQMRHGTNTFSPMPTTLECFGRAGGALLESAEAAAAFRGTNTCLGAMIAAAEQAGAEYVLPAACSAGPGGPVADEAYEYLAGRIVEAVARGCDAVLLDLHGAMVTPSLADGEGELLRRIRGVAPEIPVGVALDMHANLSPAMARGATVIAGGHTYPQVDRYQTGLRAARPVLDSLRKTTRPAMAWGLRPMLPHVMRQSSSDSPNRDIQCRAREIERQGALAASVFMGFPYADTAYAGVAAAVVTDGDPERARRWCDELLDRAWDRRERFRYAVEPLERSLLRAKALPPSCGPVVLLDHFDNCESGGTMDTTAVLCGLLRAGFSDVAVFAIHDPAAVRAAERAGVGATLTLPLGGKTDLPALGVRGRPVSVTARVKRIVDGCFRRQGTQIVQGSGQAVPAAGRLDPVAPDAGGSPDGWIDMGRCVVLDTRKVEIAVISRRVESDDIGCLRVLSIEPASKRYLMLKSRVRWRAALGGVAKVVIDCAGQGTCPSDFSLLDFRRLRRPMYPLDADVLPGDEFAGQDTAFEHGV